MRSSRRWPPPGARASPRSFTLPAPPAALPLEAPTVAILVIAVVGGFTAFFAGTMALTAYDIKRVLAFSTISQLAYMFLGLGAGAWLLTHGGETLGYTAALFHLFNHAFFKALLFLSAGSVIHAVHTNDMREMGGLARHLPITSKVMLVGSLALAGIVPFSGFFSKGEVLSATFEAAHEAPVFYLLYALGVLTALLTAFYTFRMWLMTFHGEYRGQGPPHEAPPRRTRSKASPSASPSSASSSPGASTRPGGSPRSASPPPRPGRSSTGCSRGGTGSTTCTTRSARRPSPASRGRSTGSTGTWSTGV